MVRELKGWSGLISTNSLLPLACGLILVLPQSCTVLSPLYLFSILFFVVSGSVLGYTIISRYFIQFMISSDKKTSIIHEAVEEAEVYTIKRYKRQIVKTEKNTERKQGAISLTRKRFEEYFRESKPYLNPDLKITDLVEPLKANRTVISNFINQTYGMNFNRYINGLRIKELQRLQKLYSNESKEISKLLSKAGFTSMRNYTRAISAEQDYKSSER